MGAAQLLELRIKDFAIVDELTLTLEPGLNALTGETGAGKSILIDALGAVLGDRASPALVRGGADRALIEATFSRPASLPDELEVEEADDVLILSREIGANGRGGARLNGRTVPLSVLQVAGRALVDVHGQSDHQSLLRPAMHVQFLDRFAGLGSERATLASLMTSLGEARGEIARLRGDAREMARQQDLLHFQVQEIDSAELSVGDDLSLAARRSVLANAEKLRELVAGALAGLTEDGAAVDIASAAARLITDAARLDASLEADAVALDDACAGLREIGRSLTRYADGIEADPAELDRVDDRLDLLRGLMRKYGDGIEEVLAFADRARAQLRDIEGVDERVASLESRAADLQDQAWTVAERLSEARTRAAADLAAVVEGQLGELNMAGARFSVQVARRGGASVDAQHDILRPAGIDDVEFLLAANPGEPARPLVQVASGGE
ncbi:MAG: AAA family ATPase, partial [Chloroflexi bacterium]|nr:AAA family ATPase [Chloroflexota bacterium]